VTGEDKEIQAYKGPPFKLEKSIQKIHAGFVTQIAFIPGDDAHFVTVSADKTLKVHDTETYETVIEHAGLHSMGINDFVFTSEPNEIVTCSSDRTAKVWKINFETKKLDEVRTLTLSETDNLELKENVDKQLLGLLYEKSCSKTMTVSCNSEINVWKEDCNTPETTLRGHSNTVGKVINFGNSCIVSGDNDGRLFVWDVATGLAKRASTQFKHKISVCALTCNSKFVYSASGDGSMGHFEIVDGALKPVIKEFIKKNGTVLTMTASDEHLYVLYHDMSLEILKADDISKEVAKVGQLKNLGVAKGEIASIAHVSAKNELWVSDIKGFVHILDATTLAPVEDVELKTVYGHPAVSMASCNNEESSLIALGDKNGYITVFDANTREQKFYTSLHKNKVTDLQFSPDGAHLFSVGFDKNTYLCNVSTPTSSRELPCKYIRFTS